MRLAKRIFIGLLLLSVALGGWAVQGQKEPLLYEYVKDELLVRFKQETPRTVINQIHAAIGAHVLQEFQIVPNLQRVKLPISVSEAIALYKANPNVLYAEPNYIHKKAQQVQLTPNDSMFNQLWGLHNTGQTGGTPDADIDAVEAWDITTGSSSVVVFVIDTGVDYNHPDLVANTWTNPGEIPGNNVDDDNNGYVDDVYGIDTYYNDTNPFDGDGHGTHVHGTIGAVGNNNVGVVGVNWNVKVGHCKFLSDLGSGTTAGAIACLQYILNLKQRTNHPVPVIATNNSWGGGGFSQALYDAIKSHMNAGILFIAAAGNSNLNNDTALFLPASYFLPNMIAVAATTHTDARASFSNYGRHTVHVGAPGASILSTTPGNTYSTYSGTSMATPHVTGLAALIKAQFPSFSWYQIRNRILATGDVTSGMQNITISDRRINAYNALTCNNVPFFGVWRPMGTASWPMLISVYWVNCENPAGPISVTITPGGTVLNLQDDGNEAVSGDLYAGDGIYSAIWTGPSDICNVGTFTLTFSNGQTHTVQVGGAQGSYSCTSTTPGWRTITGTNLNLGDDQAVQITPGFPIRFGTTTYNSVYVGSNGVLSFTNSITAYTNTQLPNTSYTTVVAPFWDDLYPTGADNVYWQVLGSAPTRELVIEWRNIRHYSCRNDTPAPTVTFQVVLFEATNHVLFNYQDVVFGGNCSGMDKGGSATVGVQVSTSDATQIGFNSQILSNNLQVHWTTEVLNTAALFRVERTTGNVYTDGSFIAGGADLAEYVRVSEEVSPGDVLELDPDNPKSYRKARSAYSPLIAGVVSSTPGVVLEAKRAPEGWAPLALMGRVPVKATTEGGPIRPGDLLTSSSKPGYAMRCANPQICEGALLGKALEELKTGEGVILVLLVR
ncbi:MAG: S8 family peptidase [Candidatus Bipolaricaulota bacterium]|nr:S8 family peptidase [Candidatus Bipolaricaulota bacterium]